MNQLIIKQAAVLSLMLGAALGIVTVIPLIGAIAFFILIFLASTTVLIFMHKNNMIGKLIPKDGSLLGAVVGFLSFIGFSITFIPLATIIGIFHKTSYYMGISIMFRTGFFVLVLMVIFVAMLSALMNAFSGLATVYFYGQMLNTEETNSTFTIDN